MNQQLERRELTEMTRADLERLIAAVLDAKVVAEVGQPAVLEINSTKTLVLVHRPRLGGRALSGVSVPGLAAQAKASGLASAVVVTTGVIETDRAEDLARALAKVRSATGVAVSVIDANELVSRVEEKPHVRERFFPVENDAPRIAATADASPRLVKAATAVAANPNQPHRRRYGWLRLLWSITVVVAIVALPIHVSAGRARLVALAGLAFLVVTQIVGLTATERIGTASGRVSNQLVEWFAPLPDSTAVLRRIGLGKPAARLIVAMIAGLVLLRVARLVVVSGFLAFLALFAFVYMLVWSYEPAACSAAAGCSGAFVGLSGSPSLGDFLYLAVQCAFFNVPGDVSAASRLGRAVISGEFVASAALLVGFAASLGMPEGLWSWRAGSTDTPSIPS